MLILLMLVLVSFHWPLLAFLGTDVRRVDRIEGVAVACGLQGLGFLLSGFSFWKLKRDLVAHGLLDSQCSAFS